MKTIDADLLAHYQQESTSVAAFLRVVKTDETVFGYTSTDAETTVDAESYLPGFEIASISSSEGLAVDNSEVTIIPDDVNLTEEDLLVGRFNNAAFTVFEANYADPTDGTNPLKIGNTGEVRFDNGVAIVEFRDRLQILQQPQGDLLSKNCRARLGDSRCRVDLADYTVTGTLDSFASRQVFTDAARTEDDDWFSEGELTFTSGPNTGLRQKIKSFAAGVFTLSLPLPFEPEVGDAYTAIAGCRKRHDRSLANPEGVSDCFDKFNNIRNFYGEPHGGGLDKLTRGANSEQP